MAQIGQLPGMPGMGKGKMPTGRLALKKGSLFPMMRRFMLYKNIFGKTPALNAKLGPMGPKFGKQQDLMGPPAPLGPGGNLAQNLAGFHRMGLL